MSDIIEGESTVVTEALIEQKQPTLKELLQPSRGANETREDYVVRRRSANRALKSYSKGTVVYDSNRNRPMTKPKLKK